METKDSENESEKNVEIKEGRQLRVFLLIIGLVLLFAVGVPLIKYYYFDTFEYVNLDFEKQSLGDISLFTADVPVVDGQGTIVSSYRVAFRNDPRKLLEEVTFDLNENVGLKFIKENIVYVSIDPHMNACEDNSLAMIILGGFLADSNLQVKSAVTDLNYSLENNLSFITCEDSAHNSVVHVRSGNKNSIIQGRTNCFEIEYKECEVIKSVERFNLGILEEYMSNFKKQDEL